MLEKPREIFRKAIAAPLARNITAVLFVGGILATLFGALLGDFVESFKIVPLGTGDFFLKTGSAVLGAGVFSVIMKSAQFTALFQKHIHDVFYEPLNAFDMTDLKTKWRSITQSILKSTLPHAYQNVSDGIMEQFLDSELQYHFRDYSVKYDISINKDTRVANFSQTVKTLLVISPNEINPIFTQEIIVDGDCELVALLINEKPIPFQDLLKPRPDNPSIRQFCLALRDYIASSDGHGDRVVSLERTYRISQKIDAEPYFMGTMKRFVMGMTVIARISEGFELSFTQTGLEPTTDEDPIEPHSDAEGFTRWVLARSNQLLLPGQGFVLIAVPRQ